MKKPNMVIVEADGTEVVREMNDEEYAVYVADTTHFQEMFEQHEAVEAPRRAARAALLDKLGITEDEAKLLLS